MARIRTVKPELFTHEDLFNLERDTGLPIRIAFAGLFTACDREGRFKWRPNVLKLAVLPFDSCDFSRVLDALRTRDMVRQYRVNGELYGYIPTFLKHQIINNRESASSLPEPNENNELPRVDDACGTREFRVAHMTQGERKGKEGKGREEEGEQTNVPPTGETSNGSHEVMAVFQYWQTKRGHEKAKMDDKRRRAIKGRLKDGYSVEDLCRAVDGVAKSPHHMGQNEQRTVYDDIELICRTAVNVDKFMKLAGPQQFADPGLQRQIDILQEWADQP